MKTFSIRGATVPPALARFDAAVQAFMEQNDVRAGALAVAKDGRLVFAHGYTYGEPNYPITYPTSLFRIASASKPITGIAVHQLLESGELKLTDKVADILDITLPDGSKTVAPSANNNYNDLTVENLLMHRSGRAKDGEATFAKDIEIAAAYGHEVPVSVEEIIGWGVQRPMQSKPGATSVYTNFSYLLLGRVVAAKRNQSYHDAVRTHVLAPLGIRRAYNSGARLQDRHPGEVKYHWHPPQMVASMLVPNQQAPAQYGGENNANFEGHAGWVLSAPDYVRLLTGIGTLLSTPLDDQLFWQDAPPSLPEGVKAYRHGAVVNGAFGVVGLRTDGIAIAGFWNTSNKGTYEFDAADPAKNDGTKKHYTSHEDCWNEIATRIESDNAWPAYDLFGQEFPHVTRFDGRLNGKQTIITIDTLRPDGTFNGSIADGSHKSAIEGFWNGRTKQIEFVRDVEPGKPSALQIYRGVLMQNDTLFPGSFAGDFHAFAGTGGTAKRHVFAWVASPELIVDTSQITD